MSDLEKLEKYAHEVTKALTGLTPGGSEYFAGKIGTMYTADVPFCLSRIRELRQQAHARFLAAATRAIKAETENRRLRATLSAITATDCYSRDECTAMAEAALSPAPVMDAVKQGDA